MQEKHRQNDYRFDAEWQRPEDFILHLASSDRHSDSLVHCHEPSYPVSRIGLARPSPERRSRLSQGSSWNNYPVAALDSPHSQTRLDDPSVTAYGYMSASEPGSRYEPLKVATDSLPHVIYRSPTLITYEKGSSHPSQPYDATGRLTFPTSPGLDNRYSVASLLPSTGESAEPEDLPGPSTNPRYKQVVASESVVDASMRRRKPTEKGRKIYSCTKFPPCTQTFTASHNLKNHERSHRGERPFKCGFCPAKTVTYSDIKRHEVKCKFSTMTSGPLQTL